MSRRKRTTRDDDIEEIRKGFEQFDVNGTGIINPAELLEAMDSMNIKEKNPFIYDIIESLNLEKNIRKKGGVSLDELVNYVYNKVNDTETNVGLRQIYDVINDRDTDTVSMTTFYDLARNYGDKFTEDEIRELLEKTQMGGNNLTFDEFYAIMKGAGKDNSSINVSRSSYINKNNNEIYSKKANNSNINDNSLNISNNSKIRTKKFIYKEPPKKEVVKEPEPQPEPEPEQEQEPEPEQNKEEIEIEQNKEIEYEPDRRFDSPKQNYVEEYHEEQEIEEQIPQENNINNENDNINDNIENIEIEQQYQNPEEEYNPIKEDINQQDLFVSHEEYRQEYDPNNNNIYSKDNNEIYSSPKIINPSDFNNSQNLNINELTISQPRNENSEIEYDNQKNSEQQSETSSQYKYSYRKRKIGAAPIHEKNDSNINSINEGETKYKKEKETKVTNLPDGGKQIEITEKTEVIKEKPYIRGHRYRFGRNKVEENEGNNDNKKEDEKKEDKKEDKRSYYRIRKPFSKQNEEGQVTMTKTNVEENTEVTIPKRYHRRYRESKTSNNNQ